MELKKYQEDVLLDLRTYIDNLLITRNPAKAYNKLWNDKHVKIGFGGLPSYSDVIPGVPSVCLKVPTGGGKTVIACSSLKTIFDKMPADHTKLVVWLVPWDTILTQTQKTLSDPNHFYRQRLNRDFSSKVEIYSKKQALSGQNFNPSALNEQLSILILSFDSLRSKKKDGRKVYEENSNLTQFTSFYDDKDAMVENVDDSALIQVLNQLNPVVVIDESHNARSELSVEMIKNLNPSFVLELTATPKEDSNIISIVSAERLKQANMVKLPVIAYNRPSIERVIVEAIDLRNSLEKCAIAESKLNPEIYIRPIVLFQAQPKTDEDTKTFEKIKEDLISCGIPKEYITIKTSNKNEIAKVDLLSKECKIRYIITVNALKEGWDCPFAYILASVANKTSRIDVEQILGRILRQPNQKKYSNSLLNMSYVLTSSSDFNSTLSNILVGLNSAGFSKNDCRVINEKPIEEEQKYEKIDLFEDNGDDAADVDSTNFNIESVSKEIKETLKKEQEMDSGESDASEDISTNEHLKEMITEAEKKSDEYQETIDAYEKEDDSGLAFELKDKMTRHKICESIAEEVQKIKLPEFCQKVESSFFEEDSITEPITKEDLLKGFKLSSISIPTDLLISSDNVYQFDVETSEEGTVVKQKMMGKNESEEFKKVLQSIPESGRVRECKERLIRDLSHRFNSISKSDLYGFVDRVVDSFKTEDEIVDFQNNIMSIEFKLKVHIEKEMDAYRYKYFKEMLAMGKIFKEERYEFPKFISPSTSLSHFTKTMYSEEEDNLTDVETSFASKVSALDNVLCWHRNIEKRGFCINGFMNHYPDFIVITKSGKIVLVETKGEHLSNDDSALKLELGRIWSNYCGPDKYKYFMAFMKNPMNAEGSYLVDKVIDIIKYL